MDIFFPYSLISLQNNRKQTSKKKNSFANTGKNNTFGPQHAYKSNFTGLCVLSPLLWVETRKNCTACFCTIELLL